MSAAVVALSGSAASVAAAVLRVPAAVALRVAVVPLAVPREPEVPVRVRALALAVLVQAPPRLRVLLLAELRRDRLLSRLASLLPRVAVESAAPVRLLVRRWF